MTEVVPSNLVIIRDSRFDHIISRLRKAGIQDLIVTNGAYKAPADKITGTTLAGFQHALDKRDANRPKPAFMIAVNTDKGTRHFSPPDEIIEPQLDRGLKVALPLAEKFSDITVALTFFEEATPNALFESIAQDDALNLATIFKWGGYGIDDNVVIEGAELFEKAYAHPFYNDDRPAAWDHTRQEDQSQIVDVVDLHRTEGPHGDVYLTPKNEPLF